MTPRATASSPWPKAIALSSRSFKARRDRKRPTSRKRDPARTVQRNASARRRGVFVFCNSAARVRNAVVAELDITLHSSAMSTRRVVTKDALRLRGHGLFPASSQEEAEVDMDPHHDRPSVYRRDLPGGG